MLRATLAASPIGQLSWLRCTGTVNDYAACFMVLSCRDESLTEHQQIELFIAGLGDTLRTDVQLHLPAKLDDAIIFVRAYEQRNASREGAPHQPAWSTSRFTTRPSPQPTPTAAPTPQMPPAPATTTKAAPLSGRGSPTTERR